MIEVPDQPTADTFKFRRDLIEYLLEIGEHLNFKFSTLALALDIASRFLQQKQPESKQLVLLTAFFIAAKMHEIEGFTLDLVHKFSDHSFTSRGRMPPIQKFLSAKPAFSRRLASASSTTSMNSTATRSCFSTWSCRSCRSSGRTHMLSSFKLCMTYKNCCWDGRHLQTTECSVQPSY